MATTSVQNIRRLYTMDPGRDGLGIVDNAAVVIDRDHVVDLSVQELLRLLSDQRVGNRTYLVDTELHEELG